MAGFVDEAQLHVKAGNGGAGAVSFRREAHVSRGGPDGGDGGRGGDIWLVTSTGISSLLAFKDHPHRRANDGAHGRARTGVARAAVVLTELISRSRSRSGPRSEPLTVRTSQIWELPETERS